MRRFSLIEIVCGLAIISIVSALLLGLTGVGSVAVTPVQQDRLTCQIQGGVPIMNEARTHMVDCKMLGVSR